MSWDKLTKMLLTKNIISIEKRIFMTMSENENINVKNYIKYINNKGILNDDPRISEYIKSLSQYDNINYDDFINLSTKYILILQKIFKNMLIIPRFDKFCSEIDNIYKNTYSNNGGNVADYIPQLARVNPDQYGISICTIDGQRYSIGDTLIDFSVQSCCKPINYGIVL